MKRMLLTAIAMALLFGTAHAKTMYVNDKIRITMRTGPGIDHKVIAEPQSGEIVEVFEEDRDWSHIRLSKGKEGWVLSRFLTASQPNEIQLAKLRETHEQLTQNYKTATEENELLKKKAEELNTKTQQAEAALKAISEAYDTLRSESSDFLNVKKAYEEAAEKLNTYQKKSEVLESSIARLEWKQNVIYFLSGGLLFLIGFIIGSFNNRNARRRSSYL